VERKGRENENRQGRIDAFPLVLFMKRSGGHNPPPALNGMLHR
jgi:hypothetical protein